MESVSSLSVLNDERIKKYFASCLTGLFHVGQGWCQTSEKSVVWFAPFTSLSSLWSHYFSSSSSGLPRQLKIKSSKVLWKSSKVKECVRSILRLKIKEDSVEVRACCDKNTVCEIVLLFKKQAFVKEYGLCWRCLCKGHVFKDCKETNQFKVWAKTSYCISWVEWTKVPSAISTSFLHQQFQLVSIVV